MAPDAAPQYPAPAVFRAVQVLDALAASGGPSTITEVATSLGLAKSTVSDLLVTLEAAGMARRSDNGWELGVKVLELGQAVYAGSTLVSEFRRTVAGMPFLRSETTLLTTLDGMDVLTVAQHEGQQPVRLAGEVGRRVPAVLTAHGRAMFASLADDELAAHLSLLDGLPRPTPRALRTVSELRKELLAIRERGYALDEEQTTIGVTSFAVALPAPKSRGAAPVPGPSALTPMAVSVTLLAPRITATLRDHLVRELRSLGRQLAPFARG